MEVARAYLQLSLLASYKALYSADYGNRNVQYLWSFSDVDDCDVLSLNKPSEAPLAEIALTFPGAITVGHRISLLQL